MYLNKAQRGAEEERRDWERNTMEEAKQNEDQEIDPNCASKIDDIGVVVSSDEGDSVIRMFKWIT